MATLGAAATAVRSPRFGDDWWQRGVVYQIYPRSFADSDGDGVGDLPGIIDHLDHLGPDGPRRRRDLAVADLPVARARRRLRRQRPRRGRSAVRHRGGLRPARRRGPPARHPGRPRPGHEPHERPAPLVRRRRAPSRTGPYADWYLWRDPAGDDADGAPLPPNNWVSFFGGPGWEWEPDREQFYYHTFLAEQPELNWRDPAVEAAQFAMVRGWLERGVDGFRLDVFNAFLKHPELPSNPTPAGHDRVGPPGPPLRPRPARLPGAHRPVPGDRRRARRAGCRSASCSTARSRPRPA